MRPGVKSTREVALAPDVPRLGRGTAQDSPSRSTNVVRTTRASRAARSLAGRAAFRDSDHSDSWALARRDQLLDIACEAFVCAGFHSVKMGDLAAMIHVSKPQIYEIFPSKTVLYRAALQRELTAVEAWLNQEDLSDGSPIGTIDQAAMSFFQRMGEYQRERPYGLRLLLGSLNWKVEPELHGKVCARIFQSASALIERSIHRRDAPSETAVHMVVMVVMSHLELAYEQRISLLDAQELTRVFVCSDERVGLG